jgi:tRNA-splicing ligase RtcB
MNAMLRGGARWAVERGYGAPEDLERIEEHGCMQGAEPDEVSEQAKKRQREEVGTLGSGNHYLEVQEVTEVYNPRIAAAFGIRQGDVLVSIHCGSRGLGHQIGTEFLKRMAVTAAGTVLYCPTANSLRADQFSRRTGVSGRYAGGINCALANRQVITHLVRRSLPTSAHRRTCRYSTMFRITPAKSKTM